MTTKVKSFSVFLKLLWYQLGLPEPTKIQYDIADWLEHGPRRKGIIAYRGVGKSWITSGYVLYRLDRDPQLNVLVTSASKTRAEDFSTFTLKLMQEVTWLSYLYPNKDQRSSRSSFDVSLAEPDHAPSVKSSGITGQITGSRADLIIADDIEIPNNSFTPDLRGRISESVKEFDSILKPGGEVVYLGTPQVEESLYTVLPKRGYSFMIYPARYPTQSQIDAYDALGQLAPMINDLASVREGKPTDPLRFNEDELVERELSYGKSGFNLQYMLDTSLSEEDRRPLKISDFIVLDTADDMAPDKLVYSSSRDYIEPELPCLGFSKDRWYRPLHISKDYMPYTGSVMAIDPAGRGTDETGYAVIKQLNGYLYLVDSNGLSGGYTEDNLHHLASKAKQHKVNHIVVEDNFGDGMFSKLLMQHLRTIYPVGVEGVKALSTRSKEQRIIEIIEPVLNQHRLIISKELVLRDYNEACKKERLTYSLIYQLSRITKDKGSLVKDDRLDALAWAIKYWTESLAISVDDAIADYKAQLLDKELEDFAEAYLGVKPRQGWLNTLPTTLT